MDGAAAKVVDTFTPVAFLYGGQHEVTHHHIGVQTNALIKGNQSDKVSTYALSSMKQ